MIHDTRKLFTTKKKFYTGLQEFNTSFNTHDIMEHNVNVHVLGVRSPFIVYIHNKHAFTTNVSNVSYRTHVGRDDSKDSLPK